jgi:hypothetical protein
MPIPAGLLVPWIRMLDQPRRSAWLPRGLSGPGGTTAGSGSPLAACSRRIEAGTVQAGPSCFFATLVMPSGVDQPSRPMPMGWVITSRGAPCSTGGK